MQQLTLDFPSPAKINTERLSGQNLRLYEYLMTGEPVHLFHPARKEFKLGHLPSRASDLKNKYHVPITRKRIIVKDGEEDVTVVEYSIKKENL